MAKKVEALIKLQVAAGMANPSLGGKVRRTRQRTLLTDDFIYDRFGHRGALVKCTGPAICSDDILL